MSRSAFYVPVLEPHRVCPLRTFCGSNIPLRSQGTARPTAPTPVSTVERLAGYRTAHAALVAEIRTGNGPRAVDLGQHSQDPNPPRIRKARHALPCGGRRACPRAGTARPRKSASGARATTSRSEKLKELCRTVPWWPADLSRPAGAGGDRPSGSGLIPRAGITPTRRSRAHPGRAETGTQVGRLTSALLFRQSLLPSQRDCAWTAPSRARQGKSSAAHQAGVQRSRRSRPPLRPPCRVSRRR
jgi:hypothetical protein